MHTHRNSTPSYPPNDLSGAKNPDILIGIVNGKVIYDDDDADHIWTHDYDDHTKIRILTNAKELVEIRYSETVFSHMRELHLINSIKENIRNQKALNERNRKIIVPRRKRTDGAGTNRKGTPEEPRVTILELEKVFSRLLTKRE